MAHPATRIIEKVQQLVADALPRNTVVVAGPIDPYEAKVREAVGVFQGQDDPIASEGSGFPPNSNQFGDNILAVTLEIVVKDYSGAKGTSLDARLNEIRLICHKALLADTTLGLDWGNGQGVIEIIAQGTDQPDRSDEGERPFAMIDVLFDVMYRANYRDPEVA